ncbi:MAG: TadE/TadG family type IV pilus assembly protein [Eubacteriales bacterium]
MLWYHQFRKTEKGQAVVEMALILPILLMVIFGIIEFGRILNTYMIVTEISREGSRKGAVGGTDSEIRTTVRSQVTDAGLDASLVHDSDIVITDPSTGTRPRGTSLKVQVSYPVDIIAPYLGPLIGDPYIVTSQTTMRVE